MSSYIIRRVSFHAAKVYAIFTLQIYVGSFIWLIFNLSSSNLRSEWILLSSVLYNKLYGFFKQANYRDF